MPTPAVPRRNSRRKEAESKLVPRTAAPNLGVHIPQAKRTFLMAAKSLLLMKVSKEELKTLIHNL